MRNSDEKRHVGHPRNRLLTVCRGERTLSYRTITAHEYRNALKDGAKDLCVECGLVLSQQRERFSLCARVTAH